MQEKLAREETASALTLGIEASGAKLRRELEDIETSSERITNRLRDQLGKERSDREGQHDSIMDSINAVERRCREDVIAKASEHQSTIFDLKDELQRILSEEVSARDDLRAGVVSSIEALDTKINLEFVGDSRFRESSSQERHLR